MAYLHCHNCDWSQDDFWGSSYNPIKCLQRDEKYLFELDKIQRMDCNWLKENKFHPETFTKRDLLIWELKRKIKRIEGMIYVTYEEFKEKNPNCLCPKCNKKSLNID
jgi:hypothetical protein